MSTISANFVEHLDCTDNRRVWTVSREKLKMAPGKFGLSKITAFGSIEV